MTNPFYAEWDTAFDIPPFDLITDDHFEQAVADAMEQGRAELDAIAESDEVPTFANTIEALEGSGQMLDQVLGVFYNLSGADSTPKREELMRKFSPMLADYSSQIYANQALFQRIKTVWEGREALDLSVEQAKLLAETYEGFERAGAALTGAPAGRLKEIKSRLATLGTTFGQNLLHDERSWFLPLSAEDVKGLPSFLVSAMEAAGKDKGHDGPVVTLGRSIITPFLQFSKNRDLRKKAYQAYVARGANGGDHDNREICKETLALRHEMAGLLGAESFAHHRLAKEMAKTPENVRDLLMDVWAPARAAAERQEQALTELLHKDGIKGALQPWDWHHYAERLRAQKHALNEEEVKPYFQLDQMIAAAFDCANRLFGLEFAPLDVPLYHEDARAWQVTRNGAHVAVFIGDYFARGSKRSGAWCSAIQSQARFPREKAPVVVNVCNFAKGDPALLSYDDARTLFHEFGHALHQMLSDVTYGSLSGTSVARDFVELPSQLYEHWLEVPEILEKYATHAETGEVIPRDLLDRVLAAANFDMGFQTVEYVASAIVDLEFHVGAPPADPMQRQAEILDDLGLPAPIAMRHATPHFAHVFSGGGYASAYYSYMWSEVMDADAFAAFEEVGDAFDAELAKSLEDNILSRGGTVDPEQLYLAFRGSLPKVDALLAGRGLA